MPSYGELHSNDDCGIYRRFTYKHAIIIVAESFFCQALLAHDIYIYIDGTRSRSISSLMYSSSGSEIKDFGGGLEDNPMHHLYTLRCKL